MAKGVNERNKLGQAISSARQEREIEGIDEITVQSISIDQNHLQALEIIMANSETYLESFIEGIGTLPSELRRNLVHSQALDQNYG